MAEPYRSYRPGETVLVRATVVEPCNSSFRGMLAQLRIEDGSSITITTFAPLSEIARCEDIERLKPIVQTERFLER